MKEHWPRWIFASCSNFFYEQRQDIVMYIEGEDQDEKIDHDYFEFRMDGPILTERSKNNYKLTIEINILIVSYINQTDLHRIYRLAGIIVEAFKSTIPVRRYGDDDTLLGCLSLESEVEVAHFGQIQPESRMLQATVEARYGMTLRG